MGDVGEVGDAGDLFQVGDGHQLLPGDGLADVHVGADEGDALDFIGRAVLQRLARVSFLGAEKDVVEHRRHRHVGPAAEGDSGRILGFAVGVGVLVEVAAEDLVEGVGADFRVDIILQDVPAAATGVEAGGQLREINTIFLRPQELSSGISQLVKMMRFGGKNY